MSLLLSSFIFGSATTVRAGDDITATNPPSPPATREKFKTLPPGNPKLLETMTSNFGLTMDQEREIEPLLHDEESVSNGDDQLHRGAGDSCGRILQSHFRRLTGQGEGGQFAGDNHAY